MERVVEKVARFHQQRGSGVSEERVRRMVGERAEVTERRGTKKPLSKRELVERQDAIAAGQINRMNTVRGRARVDRDSKLHWDLDREHGTAPPRAAFHQPGGGDFQADLNEKMKRRLGG